MPLREASPARESSFGRGEDVMHGNLNGNAVKDTGASGGRSTWGRASARRSVPGRRARNRASANCRSLPRGGLRGPGKRCSDSLVARGALERGAGGGRGLRSRGRGRRGGGTGWRGRRRGNGLRQRRRRVRASRGTLGGGREGRRSRRHSLRAQSCGGARRRGLWTRGGWGGMEVAGSGAAGQRRSKTSTSRCHCARRMTQLTRQGCRSRARGRRVKRLPRRGHGNCSAMAMPWDRC